MKTDRLAGRGSEGGFSAIELMTVLVLIAVSVSMALPTLNAFVERTRIRSTLDRMVADVSFARLYAVQNGRRTAVNVRSDGTYTIDTLTTGGSWAPLRTVRLATDEAEVAIRGITSLQFSSRGLLSSQTDEAILTVARGAHQDSIFVSPAGRIYRDF